jgi:hypothetical protein
MLYIFLYKSNFKYHTNTREASCLDQNLDNPEQDTIRYTYIKQILKEN